LIIKVKDTGNGIDVEILPRLFSKFVTNSARGGTGLGLYISKGIIDAHGGTIWAENNSNERHATVATDVSGGANHNGATFGFSLPLKPTLC
jgi:signal transduction histidine kinase